MSKQEPTPMTFEELEALDDRKFKLVNIGPGHVRLQNLTSAEAFEAEEWCAEQNRKAEELREPPYSYEISMLVAMLVDGDGDRIYPKASMKRGYERLGNLSISANKALVRAARELHELPPDVEGDAEEVIEEIAKNSETPPDSISSSSPEGLEELTPIS